MTVASFEQPLTSEAMERVMEAIMAGHASEELMRDFLSTLARRGETADELAAAVAVLRRHAVRVPLSQAYELCDTCGTGGDKQGTINVSTLAGFAAAAAGVRVAKHGNRAASSRCGSADLLEGLGVNLQASPAQVARCIEEAGFGFCFAPAFHPAMKQVASIRKALGIRTIFNLIGPLANPCPLTFQLVGVSEARLLRPMAEALLQLGIRHGLVVHGADGLDEVTTTAATQALEVRQGRIAPLRLTPESLGLPQARLADLRGADVARNVMMAHEALTGAAGAAHDIIVANAGCAIYVADQAATIPEGVGKAHEALAAGRALKLLERVKELSHAG
ncbi:MAG: anthranilate phosphoribosyltransferase [Candidatus Omnitrophica bacterium]|nr:anthranilate phosphoribosyltransferase [Candidatus Omnitrophota bacterium]